MVLHHNMLRKDTYFNFSVDTNRIITNLKESGLDIVSCGIPILSNVFANYTTSSR